MIKRIESETELSALSKSGVEANKIRALFLAYGLKYDFCRFFKQDDCYFSSLDGSFVLCGDSTDFGELVQFLAMNGFCEIFCSEKTGMKLSECLDAEYHYVTLMRYIGGPFFCSLTEDPTFCDIYDILRDGFDIEFEPWYLDMSHRVRHGISQCFTLKDVSTVTVQHNLNGEALISQVATRKTARGQGHGSAIIKAVSSLLSPSEVYVVCENSLVDFYKNAGYSPAGKKCIIIPKRY